ncbi:MAG: hypothetical protein Q7V48_00990 [Deltaproteobacteria bacterium]|nr:hypothetical protein [Deltaproteobacteria bacterium]
MKKIKIAGIRQVSDLSLIEVLSLPLCTYRPTKILSPLAENGINLEFIVGHGRNDETIDLTLGVKQNQIVAALGLLQGLKEKFEVEEIRSRDGVGMISLFPHGSRAAVIGNFFSAFQDAGIKLFTVTFSLSAISGLMDERFIPDALNALSEYFELPG